MHEETITTEEWRLIDRWPGYEISNHGRLRSWKKCRQSPDDALPRMKSSHPLARGYRIVALYDRGRRETVYIHREVLLAFVGPCPDGMQCRHRDGKPWNNHLDNLVWGTPAENTEDKQRHGTGIRGERCTGSILTAEIVLALRAFEGTHTEAAKAFGIRYHVAYCVRTRRTWKHVA